MKKILILDPETEVLDHLEIIIRLEFDNPLIRLQEPSSLGQYLNEVDLIITSKEFTEHLENGDTPHFYLSIDNIEEVIEQLHQLLDQRSDQKDYIEIKYQQLKEFSQSDFDLFIHLNQEKMLQVGNKENTDMKGLLDKYHQKGVQQFFLKKSDYRAFIEELERKLENEGSRGPTMTFTLSALEVAFSLKQEQLDTLGIPKSQNEIVIKSLDRVAKDLRKEKNVFALIKNFFVQENYIVEHSMLNIFFCTYLLEKLNWANEPTLKQMIYASFFHDIEIKDPELAKVQKLESIKDRLLRQQILNHPTKGAKVIDGLKGMNNDAHRIILDHHERPDGSGYPRGINASSISPLSCVFILSHEIVDFLIEEEFKTQNLVHKIQSMQEVWDQGNFKKVFECARSILLE